MKRKAIGRWLGRGAAVLAALAAVLALLLWWLYGGGEPYPGVTGDPLLADDALEVAVTFDRPIGNAAVAPDGRVFFTVHPESRPRGPVLWVADGGTIVPFPAPEVQRRLFDTPLGVAIDRGGSLWVIDPGHHGLGTPRIVALDTATAEVLHDHAFPRRVAPLGSFLQDLQVDSAGATVYVADVSFWRRRPALVVYDVWERRARRVLERHSSVSPQEWIIETPAKRMLFLGGLVALKPGVDGVALTRDDRWLYYAAMAHDTLYRVRTADLRRPDLAPAELARRVEAVGPKPLSDGLSTDARGHVLVTDVEHGAVVRIDPVHGLTTLVRTPRIRWADALSFGADGWLYIADSAIPEIMLRSRGHIRESGPYHVWRFRPGDPAPAGQ